MSRPPNVVIVDKDETPVQRRDRLRAAIIDGAAIRAELPELRERSKALIKEAVSETLDERERAEVAEWIADPENRAAYDTAIAKALATGPGGKKLAALETWLDADGTYHVVPLTKKGRPITQLAGCELEVEVDDT